MWTVPAKGGCILAAPSPLVAGGTSYVCAPSQFRTELNTKSYHLPACLKSSSVCLCVSVHAHMYKMCNLYFTANLVKEAYVTITFSLGFLLLFCLLLFLDFTITHLILSLSASSFLNKAVKQISNYFQHWVSSTV